MYFVSGLAYFHFAVLFSKLFRLIGQFTPVLALYDPFGVDVPLNFDIIKAPVQSEVGHTFG